MADDIAESFGSSASKAKATFRHPIAAFFHLLFRIAAIIVYVLASTIIGDAYFIHIFLTIVLLLALDFWTVKNVSGRLLVGLRWWNKVEEDGTSRWIFEKRKKSTSSQPEAVLFWSGLFICPLLWVLFFFTTLLKFAWGWMTVPILGIALNGANVVGYVRCRKGDGARLTKMAGQYIGKQILQQAVEQTLNKQDETA